MKARRAITVGVAVGATFAGSLYGCGSKASVRSTAPVSPPRGAIGTITLSPQAVTLQNPPAPGDHAPGRRIGVTLATNDASGRLLTGGRFAEPIRITVYAPAPTVLRAESATISSPRRTIFFDYSGGYVANPIIVTAVSGHAFSLMSFQPAHRGFPGRQSISFPMPDSARNITHGWGFRASIGGGPSHYVQLDTGSRGLVVPASILGSQAIGPGPPGKIEYTSDGKEFLGHYYLATVKLSSGDATATTVPMRVLGVNRAACAPGYPRCHVGGIRGLGVMGVGFARGKVSRTPPELSNVFLALRGIVQGSMHPGYLIGPTGVTLGISAADGAGFSEVRLRPGGTGPGDWNTAPGGFAFPQVPGYPAQYGTVLVDTGIAGAILGLPRSLRPPSIRHAVPDGERVQISVGFPMTTPVLSYGFAVGDGGPTTPLSIRWAAGSSAFVNTGRRLLSRYEYLFDAASGRVGFKPA